MFSKSSKARQNSPSPAMQRQAYNTAHKQSPHLDDNIGPKANFQRIIHRSPRQSSVDKLTSTPVLSHASRVSIKSPTGNAAMHEEEKAVSGSYFAVGLHQAYMLAISPLV